jgi:kynurenine 3-monooxygenase
MKEKNICIAGAGLVGSLLSIYLAKKGHKVDVYERREDRRSVDVIGGRSINLALSTRGWKALDAVGIADEVRKTAIPMYKRVMHATDGTLTEQNYGKQGEAIYSVSRGGLNELLMNLAEKESNVRFHFNQKCTNVDLDKAIAKFKHSHTDQVEEVKSDLIIGADGFFSSVRSQMQRQDRFNYEQRYIPHGYKELEIPANDDGSHKLETEALHIWPRGNYMLIALPNLDGSFTCTLFFPFEGEYSFDSLKTDADILKFFNMVFPDIVPLIPDLLKEYHENKTSSLGIIRCFPWVYEDKVMLIGDSSHATVPFYGQGMNSGFEDCYEFNKIMDQYGDDWLSCLKTYQDQRKPNGDAVQDLSLHNFIVMRDKTADPKFLLQKKIEHHFSTLHPNKWLPLYSMVTFSDFAYIDAWNEGLKQEELMKQVMAIDNIEQKWDSKEIEEFMLSLLN